MGGGESRRAWRWGGGEGGGRRGTEWRRLGWVEVGGRGGRNTEEVWSREATGGARWARGGVGGGRETQRICGVGEATDGAPWARAMGGGGQVQRRGGRRPGEHLVCGTKEMLQAPV